MTQLVFITVIQQTVELLEDEGYKCKGYRVDISDRDMVYRMADELREEVGHVDILINNAGIVYCKPFWEIPDLMIENTYNVNIISHYWTLRAFLPTMMAQNRGHIVTVGSVTGLMGAYGCSDYSATKYACNGLHESLFIDLRTHGYTGIDMTLICPYYINTGMFNGVRPRLFPMLEPKYVADRITGAVQKRQTWCVLPGSLKTLLPFKWWVFFFQFFWISHDCEHFYSLLPAKMCWELMSRVIRGPDSMMLFRRKGKVPGG